MAMKEFTRIEKIGFLSLLIDELKHSFTTRQGICISNTFTTYIGPSCLCHTKFPELDSLIGYKIKERSINRGKYSAFGWDNNKKRITDLKKLIDKLLDDEMFPM